MDNHIAIGLILLCDHREARIKRSMGNSRSATPVYGAKYRARPVQTLFTILELYGVIAR
ncbi:MAG: hypothetical protein ACPL8I_04280 [Chloroflexaceae bacterium]